MRFGVNSWEDSLQSKAKRPAQLIADELEIRFGERTDFPFLS